LQRARRSDNNELNQLLDSLTRRILRVLERRGLLMADLALNAKIPGHVRPRAALRDSTPRTTGLATATPSHLTRLG
jgi:hypothetical protein